MNLTLTPITTAAQLMPKGDDIEEDNTLYLFKDGELSQIFLQVYAPNGMENDEENPKNEGRVYLDYNPNWDNFIAEYATEQERQEEEERHDDSETEYINLCELADFIKNNALFRLEVKS